MIQAATAVVMVAINRPSGKAMIRSATPADTQGMLEIYNHYILNTVVTFEEHALFAQDLWHRVDHVKAAGLPWLVAEENEVIQGYAYASIWKARAAYRYTAEVTVYLAADCIGRGIGTTLYSALLVQLRAQGIHTVMGCIAVPNPASVALHEKLGFIKVAHFSEVGFKFNRWLDVGYWQKILNPTGPL